MKPRKPAPPVPLTAPPTPPGELLEVDPYGDDIERTVRWINARVNDAIHSTCVEIGQYLLDRFFDGSVTRFRSHDPRKLGSMRALKARCESDDLPLSMSTLYNYIGLAIQERAMAAYHAVYARLGHTHKILLLPLRDPEAKARLAAVAVEEGLSSRELRERVDEARRLEVGQTGRGRPVKNAILFTLERLERALDARSIDPAHFDELRRTGTYAEALERAEALEARLKTVLADLRRRQPRRKAPFRN